MDQQLQQAKVLSDRLMAAGLAASELMTAFLGLRLGLYQALATAGPLTSRGLAERANIAPRYAREWLEQQAASGFIEIDDTAKALEERLFLLPEGHAEALVDQQSLFWVVPIALLPVGGMMQVLPSLLEAYRTGTGVPYAAYGTEFHGGHSGPNRSVFVHMLPRWLRTLLPELHARLLSGIRVADVGCGAGWSSIALASTYPRIRVDAFDTEAEAVTLAEGNARDAGVTDRVAVRLRSPQEIDAAGGYGLVCAFDTLHDQPHPVDFLAACRALLADGGTMLLMEPNADETFSAPADETQRFLYAISVLHCLPVGMTEQPSAATGTMLRPAALRDLAGRAGFDEVRVIPVDHRFYRLYGLSASRSCGTS
jgi:2-polyprenyl-3-methyl-5-hydroxy-6-metoxy-1,4-benzoquinol methylase